MRQKIQKIRDADAAAVKVAGARAAPLGEQGMPPTDPVSLPRVFQSSRQNLGVNSTMRAKTSSRPSAIHSDSSIFVQGVIQP